MRDAVLIASPARNRSPEPGDDAEADEGLAGVDADPQAERCAADGREPLGVLADPERRPDCPLGIVLVGRRHAEHPDDRIADELLDDPAVGLDLRSEPPRSTR